MACFLGCLTVAMLRYRLYDIGRLVSRTISYALLSAVLAGGYLGVVSGAGLLLPGGGSLAVAAATLVVAAAFSPLRRRLQAGVDRRFNRARYDAARTVEGFAQRLRAEVDLDLLVGDLRTVVHQTLEPASTQLWLRDEAVSAGRPALPLRA